MRLKRRKGDIIRHLKTLVKPSRATGAYKQRNENLPHIGYASYVEYLKSDDWKKLRQKILRKHPVCCVCDSMASQVHHWDYGDDVMLGIGPEFLLPICDKCHGDIEFDGNEKRTLEQTQEVLRHKLKPNFAHRLHWGLRNRKRRQMRKKPKPHKPKWFTLFLGTRCLRMKPNTSQWLEYVVPERMEFKDRHVVDKGKTCILTSPDGTRYKIPCSRILGSTR